MSDVIENMIDRVRRIQRGTKPEPGRSQNPDNLYHYDKWGFTIYRTYYGKESDEHWHALLYSLRHQTKLAFGAFEEEEETNQDDMRQVRELFYLDVREDPSLLGGLDVRGLREFCNTERIKETKAIKEANSERRVRTRHHERQAMAEYLFKFVLLADQAVLKNIENGEFVVKAISLSWDGYSGWGWIRIPTGYLLELWIFLMWNKHRTDFCLRCDGPEADLEESIWPGDMALFDTGRCSEVRDWPYYSNQKDDMW